MPPRRNSRGNQETGANNPSSAGPSGQNDVNPSSGVNNSASAPLTVDQRLDSINDALKLLISAVNSQGDRLSTLNAEVDKLKQQRDENKESPSPPSAFHPALASSGQRSESSSSDQGSSSSPAGRQGPGLSGNNINSSQGSYMGSRNNTRPIVDKDLHPILNTKFTLDSSNAPKLSKTIMTADEYINWLHKVEDIVHANPRFMSVFNIAAETAWKQCGGERWTKALKDDDVDLLRWESCFLHAQRHLFTFVTQLVPEDISRGITLQMKKDRGKYNLPVRLGFRSSATTEAIAHGGFYQDVHGLMQLLEEQYNIKDCNRLLELVKKYKRLHLKDGDHPQTIFSHYHEAMNRIKSVYPQFPDFPESWMCFDILTRLPHQYRDAVKELFRKDIATLKQEDVLSRLIAEYMHIKDSSNYEKAKMSGRSFNKPSSNGATAAAATASPPSASYSSESNNPSAVRVCYKCGKQGHFAKDCPNYSKSFGQAAIAVDDEEDYSFNEENEIGHVEQEDDESSVGYSSESTGFTAIGIEH
jgi:hypothetical protein